MAASIYSKIYLLSDCNNFFVSCERLFRPDLMDKPVMVLSNNDGCVIARSQEVKDLGIAMGTAAFKVQDLIKRHHIAVFSSNFDLYLDISNRIMRLYETLCPQVEIYSVDEAFLVMEDLSEDDALDFAFKVKHTIGRCIGIPVSIGIAKSKTLSKLANHHAKHYPKQTCGVYSALQEGVREKLLKDNPLIEVWGIGRRLNEKLTALGYKTAYELSRADLKHMRQIGSKTLCQTIQELNGIDALQENAQDNRRQIMWSRSFKTRLEKKEELEAALSAFTAEAARKLRDINRFCSKITVYIRSSLFLQEGSIYAADKSMDFAIPTKDTRVLISAALALLDLIYKEGVSYAKAGVTLSNLSTGRACNCDLFLSQGDEQEQLERSDKMMQTLDKLNFKDRHLVLLGVQGQYLNDKSGRYKNQACLSCAYTTSFDQLPKLC